MFTRHRRGDEESALRMFRKSLNARALVTARARARAWRIVCYSTGQQSVRRCTPSTKESQTP